MGEEKCLLNKSIYMNGTAIRAFGRKAFELMGS